MNFQRNTWDQKRETGRGKIYLKLLSAVLISNHFSSLTDSNNRTKRFRFLKYFWDIFYGKYGGMATIQF